MPLRTPVGAVSLTAPGEESLKPPPPFAGPSWGHQPVDPQSQRQGGGSRQLCQPPTRGAVVAGH